jgi:Ala-tRNA(Pro) deacylase
MTGHLAQQNLALELANEAVAFEVLEHPRTTTALEEARTLHVDPAEIAKTLVLTTPEGFVLAVLPASKRLDLKKTRALLGGGDVRLATEEELAGAYPSFELGAVPPFTRATGDRVLLDHALFQMDVVIVEAGTHTQSLRLRTTDLLELSDGEVFDICESA